MLFLRSEITLHRDADAQQFVRLVSIDNLESVSVQCDIVGDDHFLRGKIHTGNLTLFHMHFGS